MDFRLETQRLILRRFDLDDAPHVAHLAGDKQIADMTANIPHPYSLKNALDWIRTHEEALQNKASIIFAITLKDTDQLIGAVSLEGISGDGVPSLGYWLGVPYWGSGYAFEAAHALIEFSKHSYDLKKVKVMHLVGNERSKSVILKVGFTYQENHINRMMGKEREVCVYEKVL
jgi:RimJ/RimL family protein N-acetyltransferase